MTLSLLADIGGTNSRFALCDAGSLHARDVQRYPNKEFTSLAHVITHYLAEVGAKPSQACLAVAGPMVGDEVRLTNVNWVFSKEATRRQFGLDRLRVVNDFTALAMAVPYLPAEYIEKLYGGEAEAQMPISVVGPGTGLGVGGLLWSGSAYVPLQGEGGHSTFAPGTLLEVELLKVALGKQDRVDMEHFISGSGLPFLHACLLEVNGKTGESLKPDEITWRGMSGEHPDEKLTLDTFSGLLGSIAGDQALLLGARGGVYLGGGIVPQLGEAFRRSPFRQRFLAKGRFESVVADIPIFLLKAFTETALLGAAALLKN